MTVQDNEARSSLSSDGAELSNGDESVCSTSAESTDMKDLTTASDLEDFSTPNNVAVSHSANAPEMPARPFAFLKLSPELRMRVYYYVFRLKRKLYFDCSERRTYCSRCDDEEPAGGVKIPCYCLDGDGTPVAGGVKEVDLRLLQTCRQIYEEARYQIFKWNTFHFDDFEDSELFKFRPLLPDQKSAIRSISLGLESCYPQDFVELCADMCEFISDFEGLRSGQIYVRANWDPDDSSQQSFKAFDDWEEGIALLQTLGSLHWRGVMYPPDLDFSIGDSTILGSLQLRTAVYQRHGQDVGGGSDDDGLFGDELRSLHRKTWVVWYPGFVKLLKN